MKSPYQCTEQKVDAFDLQIGDKFLDDDDHDDTIYEMVGFDEQEWVVAKIIWPPEDIGRKAGFGYNTMIGCAYAPCLYRVEEEACSDCSSSTGAEKPPKRS